MNDNKVAVAMSGGVDSSVSAALLKEQGYNVTGLMMKIWDGEDNQEIQIRDSCYGPGEAKSIENARRTADILGIPLHVIDLADEFRKEVLEYFSSEYNSGRTPSPCLRCNRKVKFGTLARKAAETGIEFDYFATGHYARTEHSRETGRCLLKKGADESKDQSYFLAFLSQQQLCRSLFPVGGYTKKEVRELAKGFGLEIEEKEESQDFIAVGYRSVIGETRPGIIRNTQGEVLGEHKGISNFTIGQRKGLGISSKEPLYVIDIDADTATVTVGGRDDIYGDELTAAGLNWIAVERPEGKMKVGAKIRSSHREAEAVLTPIDDDRVRVKFIEPQMAITPGQAVVFYINDTVTGGGTIEKNDRGKNG